MISDQFRYISPLDHRYWLANSELFEKLSDYLSEDAVVRYAARVEQALLCELLDRLPGVSLNAHLEQAIEKAVGSITARAVAVEESTTGHNVRALVNVLQEKLPTEVRHFVHLGATSYDITDTATSMRYRDVLQTVVMPLSIDLEKALITLTEREADTWQIGRTHGQYAVPITFGFSISEYVSRLGKSIVRLNRLRTNLRGKLSGAVGAYNATSLLVNDPEELEIAVLRRLKLEPSESSTQIVEPEYLLGALTELNTMFGIVANLADDLRHLQRSEIEEVRESFGSSQVGSSTMPQKRNPWNCEHVKSLWKAFMPRVLTFYLDQISEHQRDLTNSASSRFVPEFIAGITAAINRMLKVVTSLKVNQDRMYGRLKEHTSDLVLAEAAYILLAANGNSNAHEYIRRVTLTCENDSISLIDALQHDTASWHSLGKAIQERFRTDPQMFFSNPENYVGLANKKARSVAMNYRKVMDDLEIDINSTDRGL